MTTLIQQRTPHDCALACMAMLSGKTWEAANEIIGDLIEYEGDRRGMRDEHEALRRLGFDGRLENGRPAGNVRVMHRGFYISPEFFLSMAWGRRALIAVPSLNRLGGWHMVYYDGQQLFDPSTKLRYQKFEELKPEYITVFSNGAPGART